MSGDRGASLGKSVFNYINLVCMLDNLTLNSLTIILSITFDSETLPIKHTKIISMRDCNILHICH